MSLPLKPLVVGLLLSCSWQAQSADFSHLIVFGDSLSDAGQFPDGTDRSDPNFLSGKRFTNRTGADFSGPYAEVATQRLARQLGLGDLFPSTSPVRQAVGLEDGTDYATGGYTTAQILRSIRELGGSVVAAPDGTILRQRDGYLVSSPKADPDALYYLNGGGNDFFNGVITGVNSAQESASRLVLGAKALADAGAETLVVSDLPDVSQTPAAAGSPALAAAKPLVQVFNAALGQGLATLNPRLQILRLDTNRLFDEVKADPARFGFATPDMFSAGEQLGNVCFDGRDGSCQTSTDFGVTQATADPDQLLFYDGVHPTARAQQVLADQAYSFFTASDELSLLTYFNQQILSHDQGALYDELEMGRSLSTGDWQLFARGAKQTVNTGDGYANARAEGDDDHLMIGALYQYSDTVTLTAALSRQNADLDLKNSGSDYDIDGQTLHLGGQYRWSIFALEGQLNYGQQDVDSARRLTLGVSRRTETGSTDAESLGAALRIKMNLVSDQGDRLMPYAGVKYLKSRVDGFKEDQLTSTSLDYEDFDNEAWLGEVGLGFRQSGQHGVIADIAWLKPLQREATDVSFSQQSYGGQADTLTFAGYKMEDESVRGQLGYFVNLSSGVRLNAAYHYWFADDDQSSVSVSAALTF